MGDGVRKRERISREYEAKRWALTELQTLTTQDREKLPCCFEYRALHAVMQGTNFAPVCPPPGTSNRLDGLSL